jgi:hypothetical protein
MGVYFGRICNLHGKPSGLSLRILMAIALFVEHRP